MMHRHYFTIAIYSKLICLMNRRGFAFHTNMDGSTPKAFHHRLLQHSSFFFAPVVLFFLSGLTSISRVWYRRTRVISGVVCLYYSHCLYRLYMTRSDKRVQRYRFVSYWYQQKGQSKRFTQVSNLCITPKWCYGLQIKVTTKWPFLEEGNGAERIYSAIVKVYFCHLKRVLKSFLGQSGLWAVRIG